MVRVAPCSSPSSSLDKLAAGFLSIAAQFEKRGGIVVQLSTSRFFRAAMQARISAEIDTI